MAGMTFSHRVGSRRDGVRGSRQWTGGTAQHEYDVREGKQAQGGNESAHRRETNRGRGRE